MWLFVGFSKPKSKLAIASYLIRLAENSDFSHVYIAWYSQSLERTMIYHASHGMAHFLASPKFDQIATVCALYAIDVPESVHRKVVQNCVDLAGTKYGYVQLLGMGIERVTGLRNPFRDGPDSYVCSELVGELLKNVEGFDTSMDLELVGPKQLQAAVVSLPQVKRLI